MHWQRRIKVKLKTCIDTPGEVSGRQKMLDSKPGKDVCLGKDLR